TLRAMRDSMMTLRLPWYLRLARLLFPGFGLLVAASQLGCGKGSTAGSEPNMLSLIAGEVGQSGNVDGTGSAARFARPWGVAADGAGSLYVADSNNNSIRKVVLDSGLVSTLAGGPMGMIGSTDGAGSVARFDGPW